mgnify:CR=1 FL=1
MVSKHLSAMLAVAAATALIGGKALRLAEMQPVLDEMAIMAAPAAMLE